VRYVYLTFKSLRLTLCTTSVNIQKFCVLPISHLCFLRVSQNKERFFSVYSNNLSVFITEAVFSARYELGL
jgi:hypothetical protein